MIRLHKEGNFLEYEEVLRKDIASKRFANVYLIFGDDSYLKNYYKDYNY